MGGGPSKELAPKIPETPDPAIAIGQFGADWLAFGAGLASWVEITVLGRLYLGEVCLLGSSLAFPLLVARVRSVEERRRIVAFFVGGLAYLCALCVADLYRSNPSSDYLRGWARAGILLTNVAGLLVLGYRRPERLMLFLGGSAISQLLLTAVGARWSDWKFGLAYPVSLGALLLLDSRKRTGTALVLLGLAVLHLSLDYRSFAGFFLVVALGVFAKAPRGELRLRLSTLTLAALATLGFVALYGITSQLSNNGREVQARRIRSNAERAAGLIVGYQFVKASPLLGYGSWPRSDDALVTWAVLQSGLGSDESPDLITNRALASPEGNEIRTHSMILQAWVEAGIVGALFFVYVGVLVVRLLVWLVTKGPLQRYYALGLFFGVWALWALMASPFAGDARLNTGVAIALLFVLVSEGRKEGVPLPAL